ncbi:MAG: DUF1343 domain-containing protein [Lachnospiraceae bacterium]|nr:DUF1343 domain-containing protein [Lachnospiraceae bacterium]
MFKNNSISLKRILLSCLLTAGLSVLSGCAKAQPAEPLFNVEINEEESLPGEETGYNLQEADNKETDIDLGDEIKAGEDLTESSTEEIDQPEEITEKRYPTNSEGYALDIVLGDERSDMYLPLLEGKRVAVFSNGTGIVGDDLQNGKHIVDFLIENNTDVSLIFSPEHGFRGTADAGESVKDGYDEKTGVTIVSLYGGAGNALTDDKMALFDTLIVDIQDVGLRYYTYYITMYKLMDACAKYDKEVLILDRPNPNGFYVDGPILKEGFKSGVGALPIPVVHGLTLGELARMIVGEGWLSDGAKCSLTVIPCENYSHKDFTKVSVNPSPNLKSMRAIYLYASTCYFENTVISVGRGTDSPFEIYGCPEFEAAGCYDFSFTPISMEGAKNPQYSNLTCYGRDLRTTGLEKIREDGINLEYVIDAYEHYKELNKADYFFGKQDSGGHYWIDLLMGTDSVRGMIEAGQDADTIKESWAEDIKTFKEKRALYLLYEDIDQ